jgi:hypothetical protein
MSMDVQTKILENGDLELKMVFKSKLDRMNFNADFNNAEYDNLCRRVVDIIETNEKMALRLNVDREDNFNLPDVFTDMNSAHEYVENEMGWFHDLGKLGKTILKRVECTCDVCTGKVDLNGNEIKK